MLAIFLNASLLFLVEPMVARLVLPSYGGSPQVWNACLLFFQVLLLAGYGYAHLSVRWMGANRQWWLHLPLLIISIALLAVRGLHAPAGPGEGQEPVISVLLTLTGLIGLPFFAISAGAPLIQRWFATTTDENAKDPYFLYAASNFGSMVALIAYPLIVEPKFGLHDQGQYWTIGLCALAGFIGACGLLLPRASANPEVITASTEVLIAKKKLTWVFLGAVPSSLLLGVTTYLSTNIAPVPLLWVVPLALYLITFTIAFSARSNIKSSSLARILPLGVTPLALILILESSEPLIPLSIVHLAVFFTAALMCHVRLNEDRPHPEHLTEFYFWIALGGVVGGLFNAIVSPLIFNTLAEYPLGLVLACLLRPARTLEGRTFGRLDAIIPVAVGLLVIATIQWARLQGMEPTPLRTMLCIGVPTIVCFLASDRPYRYALCLVALFLTASTMQVASDGSIILSERSFFGVHRVVTTNRGRYVRLVHGNTLHGVQDRQNPRTPLTYYTTSGPIGQVFQELTKDGKKPRVALVGLGVGSLAAYGVPGEQLDYFEIDPIVIKIATNPKYFSFVSGSKAKVSIIQGDARLSLAKVPSKTYHLIALDAFSSDAIPVHLLTEEAIKMDLDKLDDHGILCVHISNRYLDLAPVLANAARDLGMKAFIDEDSATPEEMAWGKRSSIWVALVRDKSDLDKRLQIDFTPTDPDPNLRPWTDDFSNVLSVFKPDK